MGWKLPQELTQNNEIELLLHIEYNFIMAAIIGLTHWCTFIVVKFDGFVKNEKKVGLWNTWYISGT